MPKNYIMIISNDIALRPRFKRELFLGKEAYLKAFNEAKVAQKDFVISVIDDHIFIRFPKKDQHFWSPQLHLEINDVDKDKCMIYGLFGPSPTVWTMFMFLHFLVAGLFVAFGVWAYTNWSLGASYAMPLTLLALMLILWIVLYVAGSIGKASGKKDMHKLKDFMDGVIK